MKIVGYTDCELYYLWVMGGQCGLNGLWVVSLVGCLPAHPVTSVSIVYLLVVK